MLKSYFKIAWRNLLRSKSFSVINISGLAVGMASAMLIFLWAKNEFSYDRLYARTDRILKIFSRDKINGELQLNDQSPTALAGTLKKTYPEVENTVRFRNVTFLTTAEEKHLNVRGAFVDSSFLYVFDFPLLKGNADVALSGTYSIVLTQQLAQKLFGNEDAIGKTVRIDSTDNFTVTAVLKNLPSNTQFNFEYLIPWNYIIRLGWITEDNWFGNFANTYVVLKPGSSEKEFAEKIEDVIPSHTEGTGSKRNTQVFTQPLKKSYLYSRAENGQLVGGRIETVRLFIIIAIFILLIACINFMNLSTARSEKRAKEVGVRKVIGAAKKSLVTQFIGESILYAFVAFLLAIVIVKLSLPKFNLLTGKDLFLDFTDPFLWLFAVGFILVTGFVAGSYPAFYLSSFTPSKVLKGSFEKANALITPRKLLVVLQFSFAIILIICTVVVEQQIKHAQSRNAGYNQNNLIYTFTQGDVSKHFDLIKHDLLNSGATAAVTKSFSPITSQWNQFNSFQWQGSTEADKNIDFGWFGADADFVKATGVKLIAGRDINVYNYPTDTMAMLLNREAVRQMGLKNPIGETVTFAPDGRQWHVIGVVDNFILESPYKKTNPLMIVGPSQFFQVVHIKLNPATTIALALKKVEKVFSKYNPNYPFEYYFVDESYAEKFADEKRTRTFAQLFAGLTIFISCLGLFGLAACMAENRIKEIGVRKVLSASAANISFLLSRDFLRLIIIAIIIASPVAYYVMNNWLSNYEYRTEMRGWTFLVAGLASIIIGLATVSYQAVKAALANPVKNLRTE